MLIQSSAGNIPSTRQTGGTPNNPGGTYGEALMSELAPQYYTLLKAGKVFSLSASGVNPAAFTGGAAGTPLLGLYNPANSHVDLVILRVVTSPRNTGTAAAAGLGFNFYAANQGGVAVTGTQTQARNMYTQSNTGSAAYGMVNTANTAALASSLIMPSTCVGVTTTTPGVLANVFADDLRGSIIVAPGCYLAYGATLALTAGVVDATLIWAEIPV